MAELSALSLPDDPKERQGLDRAREAVRFFASLVLAGAKEHRDAPGVADLEDDRPGCRLRLDTRRPGFSAGTVPELAPESAARLVRVPRVL